MTGNGTLEVLTRSDSRAVGSRASMERSAGYGQS
jgi:hypothetical protein